MKVGQAVIEALIVFMATLVALSTGLIVYKVFKGLGRLIVRMLQ
jgi:di/tricarboxylate transporter